MSLMTATETTDNGLIPAIAVATLLGVSTAHFYDLRKEGMVGPQERRLGRVVRWSRQEVLQWIEAGCPSAEQWKQQNQ